jgi:hypothetical protein
MLLLSKSKWYFDGREVTEINRTFIAGVETVSLKICTTVCARKHLSMWKEHRLDGDEKGVPTLLAL